MKLGMRGADGRVDTRYTFLVLRQIRVAGFKYRRKTYYPDARFVES